MELDKILSNDDKILYRALIENTYDEIRDEFKNLFKLDVFPEIIVDYSVSLNHPVQTFVGIGTEIQYDNIGDKPLIKAIIPDEIIVKFTPIYTCLSRLGFKDLLHPVLFDIAVKEFVKELIIYQLIKAHSMKYEYDRFFGAVATKPQREILKPIIDEENDLRFYKDLQNFYKDKMPNNKIGLLFTDLNFKIIEYTERREPIKSIATDLKLRTISWEIISTIRETMTVLK